MKATPRANIDAALCLFKRCSNPIERVESVQAGRRQAKRPRAIYVLRRHHQRLILDGVRRPARDILGQRGQRRQRSFSSSIPERVGRKRARIHCVTQPRPDDIAQIRHRPLVAGLDEPVVIQSGNVRLYKRQLFFEQRQQRSQRLPLLRIAQTINHRQSGIESLTERSHRCNLAHDNTPTLSSSSTRIRISAPALRPARSIRAGAAGSSSRRCGGSS